MNAGRTSVEHEQLRGLVREFVERVVRPVTAELDSRPDPEDCFSWEIVEQASEIGLRTLTLAPEWGGAGVDSLTAAIVVEELAKGDLGISVVIAQTLKIAQTLQAACTPAQRERFLPAFRDDPRYLLAIGFTEPDNASNYIIPFDDPGTPYRTFAEKVDGGYVINGLKHFVSNGNRASLYVLFAQTEKGKSLVQGSTCFLIPRDTPGFTNGRVHNKMGERLANNAELIFRDCFVPDDQVLGEVGRASTLQAQFFPASNAYAAASVLGVAEEAYRRALEWTQTRVQGGKRLIEHDTIVVRLARMRMHLDACRTYVHSAAWAADHREDGWDPTLAAFPKVLAAEVAWEVVTEALELHGGYGYMRELGFEKLVRDAAAFHHSDGPNLTLLLKGAKAIRGF